MNKRRIGSVGEEKACTRLAASGFEIIAKNYKVREGEIDIVAKKDNKIGFFEVKLRNSLAFGHPATSLPKSRLFRMSNASLRFLAENPQFATFDMSFYLVTITGDEIKIIPIDFS